jgi:hypothetical protein
MLWMPTSASVYTFGNSRREHLLLNSVSAIGLYDNSFSAHRNPFAKKEKKSPLKEILQLAARYGGGVAELEKESNNVSIFDCVVAREFKQVK